MTVTSCLLQKPIWHNANLTLNNNYATHTSGYFNQNTRTKLKQTEKTQ